VEATVEANRDGHGGLAGWPSVEGYRLNRKAGLVIEPDVARLLRAREKATGSGTVMVANDLAGYSAVVTKSSPDGFLVFGDWSQVLPMEWGIIEVGVDFYGVNSAYSREDSSACAPFGYAMWSASNRRVCEDHEHHMMEYEANQRQQVQVLAVKFFGIGSQLIELGAVIMVSRTGGEYLSFGVDRMALTGKGRGTGRPAPVLLFPMQN